MTQQNVYHIEGELFAVDREDEIVEDCYLIYNWLDDNGADNWRLGKCVILKGQKFYKTVNPVLRNGEWHSFVPVSAGTIRVACSTPTLSGIDKFDWPVEEDIDKVIMGIMKKQEPELGLHYLPLTEKAVYQMMTEAYKAAPKNQWSTNDIREKYKEWCKATKRNGSVLVGGSIQEFFDYLESASRPIPIYIEFEEGKG